MELLSRISKGPRTGSKLAKLYTACVAMALIGVITISAIRIVRSYQPPGPFDSDRQGYCDFHNGVYFPSLAFRSGISPYGQDYARDYPVERSIPFFSPAILLLHAPFTWLALSWAEFVYFLWMVGLVLAIAVLISHWLLQGDEEQADRFRWDYVLTIALGILISRGGQQTIFTGYFTFELVLATLLAVHYARTKPWLSALALVVVSAKPNYALPLGILMLARGDIKPLLAGGVLSVVLAIGSAAWILPDTGIHGLLQQIQHTQEIHRADPIEDPRNNWIRIDSLAIIAKWTNWSPTESAYLLGMLVLLAPAIVRLCSAFERHPADEGTVIEPAGGLLLVTSLVTVYHQVYDSLILFPFLAGLILGIRKSTARLGVAARYFLIALLAFPSLNYLSSQMILNKFEISGALFQVVTSLNAVALFIAWILLLIRPAPQASPA